MPRQCNQPAGRYSAGCGRGNAPPLRLARSPSIGTNPRKPIVGATIGRPPFCVAKSDRRKAITVFFPSGNPEIVPISGGRAMLAPTEISVSVDFRFVREIATGLSALAMTRKQETRAEPMGNFPLSTVNCQFTCGRLREGVAERSESSKQMIAGGNHTTSKKTSPTNSIPAGAGSWRRIAIYYIFSRKKARYWDESSKILFYNFAIRAIRKDGFL